MCREDKAVVSRLREAEKPDMVDAESALSWPDCILYQPSPWVSMRRVYSCQSTPLCTGADRLSSAPPDHGAKPTWLGGFESTESILCPQGSFQNLARPSHGHALPQMHLGWHLVLRQVPPAPSNQLTHCNLDTSHTWSTPKNSTHAQQTRIPRLLLSFWLIDESASMVGLLARQMVPTGKHQLTLPCWT